MERVMATKWGAMAKTINAATKKKPISFTTKDGKSIAFKSGGVKKAKTAHHVKQLEKRLSAMEKAVQQYNSGVAAASAAKKEKKVETVDDGGKKVKVKEVGKTVKGATP